MIALCPICGKPCGPGQDLIQGIPVKLDYTGKRDLASDPSGDATLHVACIEAARQMMGRVAPPEELPKPVNPLAKSGVTIERADILSFLAGKGDNSVQ